jgi:hypothetical protein
MDVDDAAAPADFWIRDRARRTHTVGRQGGRLRKAVTCSTVMRHLTVEVSRLRKGPRARQRGTSQDVE